MRICLSMIVKNEAAVIERCLRAVRPHSRLGDFGYRVDRRDTGHYSQYAR
jgi:hypothetical protein